MAKRKATKDPAAPAEPLKETQPANEAEAELVGILRAMDDFGVSIVEEQWRNLFSDSERNMGIAWVAARRRGVESVVPGFLLKFATPELQQQQEAYLQQQREIRNVVYPCLFGSPTSSKTEEGDMIVVMKIKVPDSHLTGSKALELFGKTRARIEFSRRPVGEWGQGEMEEGPRRIVCCVTEIPSFGWADGKFTFSFRIEGSAFHYDEAFDFWKNQGSVRVEVLGDAVEEGEEAATTAAAPKKPGRPKKPKPEANGQAPATPQIPGTTEADLADSYSVAFTEKYNVSIAITRIDAEKFSCVWAGTGPAGGTSEPEPSVRASVNQAAIGSIGKAVDYWRSYTDPESEQVLASLRHWLKELEAGKTPKLIEAEDTADDESESPTDDESQDSD